MTLANDPVALIREKAMAKQTLADLLSTPLTPSLADTLAYDHPFVARFFSGLQARCGQPRGAGAG